MNHPETESSLPRRRAPRRAIAIISVAAAATLVLAACSPSKSSSSGSGTTAASGGSSAAAATLPAEVDVTSIQDLTGAVGSVGIATQNGMNLAVKQIAASGMLGSTKINITYKDTATTAAQAVSLMTAAAAGSAVAIFGPVSSQEAVAVAPIAQSSSVPTIFTQAGSDGIISAGNFNYRVTAPQQYYQPKMVDYLKAQGVKTVSFIYDSAVPTTKAITETTLPPLLKAAGITVKGSYGFATGTTDYSAYVSKVVTENPDAVGMEGTNPEVSPVITSLRNAGYKGKIFGGTSFGAASLKAAGDQAKGVVWATDFDPKSTFPQTVTFVKAYEDAYSGAVPTNYAAEGYDAVYLLAYGLKATKGTLSRATLQAGLAVAVKAGFSGALGPLTFEGNDLRQSGYLQTFDGTAVTSVTS
jgi:branched-chain amino acid transport system substrate-binding protein